MLEATEQFDRIKPDIIFMDIQMPLMNGFENDKIIRTMTSGQESTNYHTIGRY
jgi:CheY-like chemotaxis protein